MLVCSSALYVYPREEHTGETGKNICALGSCLFTTTTKGRRNRRGQGGLGYIPHRFWQIYVPIFQSGGQIMPTTLLLAHPLEFSEPSYGPATRCKD